MAEPAQKKRDSRHIYLRLVKAKLEDGAVVAAMVPCHATDQRLLRERNYRIGDQLRCEITKPRILGQHRKAHILGQMCIEHLDGFAGLGSHDAIKRLQRESGVCCELEAINAGPVVEAILSAAQKLLGGPATAMLRAVLPEIKTIDVTVPRSLAFDRMEQGEFEQFYRGICAHLAATYWPDCTSEKVEEMAELFDRESC